MGETSASLLERLRGQPDGDTWRRLVGLYTPLLRGWLHRHGLQQADADDLVQEVLAVVIREVSAFQHNGRPGAFRAWLRTVAVHRLHDFWRKQRSRPAAAGTSSLERILEETTCPESELSRRWDEEHDRHVVRGLLEMIRGEVAPSTWEAFRRLALEGKDERTVAAELGLSLNAVFIAKSRVLHRLRREADGLIG